jgi:hypothetical protein
MSFANTKSKPHEADGLDLLVSPPAAQPCWAAVSFVFEDAPWCDWIYREFDGSRVPRPLAGRPSRHGFPYPDRLSVSPDPADPQQLESYAETLKIAQYLIIIVSPNSSHDQTAQEHMRLFRAAGGEERIIALVVKGEPASGSAEPGSVNDASWLPKWLAYRFKGNTFEAGVPNEPMIIDARLGVSSLAEVRARLCAAMLEVPVSQLGELGVMIRHTTTDVALQNSTVIVPMPEPTPLPTLAALATAETVPSRRHSHWPVILCSIAAVAALAFLAFWPAHSEAGPHHPTVENLTPPYSMPEARPQPPARPVTEMHEAEPLVAIVPMKQRPAPPAGTANALAATPGNKDSQAVVSITPASVSRVAVSGKTAATAAPAPLAPPNPSETTTIVPAGTNGSASDPDDASHLTPGAESAERKRYELASRRDRLVRFAESKVNAGEIEEGIASFEQAIETANELVQRTDGGRDEVVELAQLYRRLGNLVTSVNSTAEGRSYFERGRRALQALRTQGKLPAEAARILAELDSLVHAKRN